MRLEITRTLPAPPEQVWRALTDPAALAAWFWPHLDNAVEVELRTGGRYRITGPRAGIAVAGEYLEIDPPKRLVFTWQWDGEAEQSRVTIELSATTGTSELDATGATALTLVHDRIADGPTRDQFAQGWHDCLDRLLTFT
jgi:uncharacterized protein YndB with AHSA1/START domain